MHEYRATLVHLAARVSHLRTELEELDRLLLEVVTPKVQDTRAALESLQGEIRDLAGMERIDIEAGVQIAEEASQPAAGKGEGGGAKTKD